MNDLSVARSHVSINIENLTPIPVGGSITLIKYPHRQLEMSEARLRIVTGLGWFVPALFSSCLSCMVFTHHLTFFFVVLLDHVEGNKVSTGRRNFPLESCQECETINRLWGFMHIIFFILPLELR